MKIYIWGTGNIATEYMQMNEIREVDLQGFIETKKSCAEFFGKKVYEPYELLEKEYDYIFVCVYHATGEIYDIAKKLGIKTEKMIFVNNWEWVNGKSINQLPGMLWRERVRDCDCNSIKNLFPKFYEKYIKANKEKANRYIPITRNGFDLVDSDALIWHEDFNRTDYISDYVRYRTFELVANEIIRNNIKGDIAELGVFRGMFAKYINAKFPDKDFYLFDTFESFELSEFAEEVKAGRCEETFINVFRNTSVEIVLHNMLNPSKCIIKKGFFPETTAGMEEKRFAFVSLDVDLEKSILEGLRYFYPRLNVGGVLFVHDYNNKYLEGVKKAVWIYEEELGYPLAKIPIADEGGTLIIYKS